MNRSDSIEYLLTRAEGIVKWGRLPAIIAAGWGFAALRLAERPQISTALLIRNGKYLLL
jgi:hypothetical protein